MQTPLKLSDRNNDFSKLNQADTLMIGIGNSARSDDGLGWAFLDRLKKLACFEGEIIYCYQLQVEDAELISHYPRVIFVDACEGVGCNGFEWATTDAINDFTFTTHALTPGAVLFLCNDLYHKYPEAHTLKIKGHDWKLKTGLSDLAEESLEKALIFFKELVAPAKGRKRNLPMGMIENSIY